MKKLLFILIFLHVALFANVGKISAFNGSVIIDRNSAILTASVGFMLEKQDIIKTAQNSRVQVILNDGTVVSTGQNAILNLVDFDYDTNNTQNSKVNIKFAEGAFRTITGGVGKIAPERFKLETKSASIGIRGTIIIGDQTMIACTQGEIDVSANGISQIIPAGMMTFTPLGGTPTPPQPIDPSLFADIEFDLNNIEFHTIDNALLAQNLDILFDEEDDEWGYWDENIDNTNNQIATTQNFDYIQVDIDEAVTADYSGTLANVAIYGGANPLYNGDGIFNASIDIGGGANNLNGSLSFSFSDNTETYLWKASFIGDATSTSLISNNFSTMTGSDIETTSGSLGDCTVSNNYQNIDGTFSIFGSLGYDATGDFTAERQ